MWSVELFCTAHFYENMDVERTDRRDAYGTWERQRLTGYNEEERQWHFNIMRYRKRERR